MPTPDADTLDAWRSLLEAHRRVTDALDADLRHEHGLSLEWYDVLFQLHDHGGRLRMNELADELLVSRSNCTRLVDRMSRAGLVERIDDPDDGRGRHAVLTAEGRRRFRRAARTHLDGIETYVGRPLSTSTVGAGAVAAGLSAVADAQEAADS